MQINKAIITAAGKSQSHLPLQTVVDRAGRVKTAMDLLLDEVTGAGIEEVAVIIRPGQAERYRQAIDSAKPTITFIEQDQPRGYGDAILRARDFCDGQAFLHMVSDHLYLSRNERTCAAQLVELAQREQCTVSAVQPTRENQLTYFGAIGGRPVARTKGLYEVNDVIEKPTPTVAEQHLIMAGQRSGHYLCLFGMHVLTSNIFALLEASMKQLQPGENANLSASLHQLAQSERYLALELNGVRYNIGEKYGLLIAQLAIALSGGDRDQVLTELLELIAKN
jgi:UTP--glucose-1-phosphate uridylyltransferase